MVITPPQPTAIAAKCSYYVACGAVQNRTARPEYSWVYRRASIWNRSMPAGDWSGALFFFPLEDIWWLHWRDNLISPLTSTGGGLLADAQRCLWPVEGLVGLEAKQPTRISAHPGRSCEGALALGRRGKTPGGGLCDRMVSNDYEAGI